MEKYDFIKCMNLHKKLKEKVKGSIFISVDENTLCVNIHGGHKLHYKGYINDIKSIKDIDKLCESVVYDYHKFIMETYFI